MIRSYDVLWMSWKALSRHKLRTFLSTLGIVFGVAAVVSMVSIGEGARQEAAEQIRLLGTDTVWVRRLELSGRRLEEALRRHPRGLTNGDARSLQEASPDLFRVSPLKFVQAEVRGQGRHAAAQVVGTTAEYPDVVDSRPEIGRFLSSVDLSDTKRVCVLGARVRDELFGAGEALGASVQIGRVWFTVVGIMEPRAAKEGPGAVLQVRNVNRDVYIPLTTALHRFPQAEDPFAVDEIAVRVREPASVSGAARVIDGILERRHRGVRGYEVVIPEELLAQAQRTQRLFNIVVGSIAGISLLVGGIGIMNIMLANVSERTREIGVRRAVGATRGDIMAQFLAETVLVCSVGGALGILIGLGMAEIISAFAGWRAAFAPLSVMIAFGTAASVGLVFGLFPARRAARLDPVQALRFE